MRNPTFYNGAKDNMAVVALRANNLKKHGRNIVPGDCKTSRQLMPIKSGKKEDIIDYIIYTELIPNYVRKLEYWNNNDIDDMIQDIYLYLLEMPQDKWDKLYEQGKTAVMAYVSGVVYRSIHSANSPIYKKYKKKLKYEVKISEQAWNVFDETGVMLPFDESIIQTENKNDIIWRKLENGEDLEKLK